MLNVLSILRDEPAVTGLDFSTLISTLTATITPAQVLTYMGAVVAGGIGIWLAWLFGRKAVKGILNAISGKKPRV